MTFDPAIAASRVFRQSLESGELGPDRGAAEAAEEIFSSSAGADALEAYRSLLDIGRRYPDAQYFHAFCIYATWQQAAEQTVAAHFHTGLDLCDRLLAREDLLQDTRDRQQICELRASFRAGLGLGGEDDELEFEKDVFKGGD